jgi:hypothetical protein
MKPKLFAYVFVIVIIALSTAVAQTQEGAVPGRGVEPPPPGQEGYGPGMPAQSVPSVLTLPAGTLVTVRTTQTLSSDHNRPGDTFTTVLDQVLIAQGWVVARRGQTVMGRVVDAQKTGQSNASSQLAIELNELSLVDGQPMPIRTQLVQVAGGNSPPGRNEAIVGTTTGTGAVIGAIAGGGTGAAIGAAIGAAAGVAGVLSTRGRPTDIYPEAQLTFRLQNPVTISTEQSQQAFLPVTPDDYNRGPVRNPDGYPSARGYPPPAPPYYYPYYYGEPYYYGYYGYYPYTYFGYYGYGPRYYVGPRVYGYRRGR